MPKLLNILATTPDYSGDTDTFHWPMNEGSGSTTDEVINSNTATLDTGATWSSSGPNGTDCIAFDGSADGRLYDSGFSVQMGTSSFSVAFWVYINSWTEPVSLLSDADPFLGGYGYLVRIYSETDWQMMFADETSTASLNNSHGMSLDTWYHVCITVDRSTPSSTIGKFYRNGSYINSNTTDASAVGSMSGGTPVWEVATYANVDQYNLEGRMCDLWTFRDKVLTASEVLALYKYLGS